MKISSELETRTKWKGVTIMAFFDEVGKKLTKAGQGVAQSTKNVATVAKLNSAISDEEKNINRQLLAIGQAYFDLHKDNPEEAMAEAVGSIIRSQEQIARCKEQVRQIKGMVNCPNCGAEVAYSAAFCNACGHPMPQHASQPAAGNGSVCSKCGARLGPTQKFCTTCGTPVAQPAPQPVSQLAEKFCPYCNAKVAEGTTVCPVCGQPVE